MFIPPYIDKIIQSTFQKNMNIKILILSRRICIHTHTYTCHKNTPASKKYEGKRGKMNFSKKFSNWSDF